MHKQILALGGAALLLAGCSSMDLGGGVDTQGQNHAVATRKADVPRKNAMAAAGITAVANDDAGHYIGEEQADLRTQLLGSGVTVTRKAEAIIISLPADATFPKASADIDAKSFAVLNTVAGVLSRYPATYIDIVGHADSQGTAAFNKELSERRANATAGYLVDHKVKSERIYVAGVGETMPIASNDTAEGRARNRRVEITLRPMVVQ